MHGAGVSTAARGGVNCRPVREPVAAPWACVGSLGAPPVAPGRTYIQPVGLDPDVEARLLSAGS